MGLFQNLGRALDSLNEQATKHIGPAAAQAAKQVSTFGQKAAEHAIPAAQDLRKHAEKLGNQAGTHLRPVAEEALQRANVVANEFAKRAAPAASDAIKHLHGASNSVATQIGQTDWSFVSDFGDHVGQQIGVKTDAVWEALLSGDMLENIKRESESYYQIVQEHFPGMGDRVVRWIVEHPMEAAALAACASAAPAVMAITPAALGLLGFGSGGIAAGSLAAGAQAGMGGTIASGSAFTILQSAGAGGPGLMVIKAIAGSTTMASTCTVAATGFLNALKKDECDCDEKQAQSETQSEAQWGVCHMSNFQEVALFGPFISKV